MKLYDSIMTPKRVKSCVAEAWPRVADENGSHLCSSAVLCTR